MTGPSPAARIHRAFVNPSEGRLRAGWRLFVGLVAFGVGTGAVAVVVSLLNALLVTVGVGVDPGLFVGQFVSYAVLTAVIFLLAWFVGRRTLADLGVGGRGWWGNLGFGLALGVVMTSTVFAVELATGLIAVERVFVSRPGFGFASAPPVGVALALTFLFFVGVGFFEELLIRGYLMTNVAEGLNGLGPLGPRAAIGIAAVLTSAVFGVLHLNNPNATAVSAFNIAVVGLFFAGAYVATGDLGVPIGVHITWNFAISSVYGFPVSGITTPATVLDVRQTGAPLVTGGRFGPEAGLVVYVALAAAVGLTWWWVRRTRGRVGFPIDVAVPDLRNPPDETQEPPEQPRQTTGGGAD